jgi:hypothetical protein
MAVLAASSALMRAPQFNEPAVQKALGEHEKADSMARSKFVNSK